MLHWERFPASSHYILSVGTKNWYFIHSPETKELLATRHGIAEDAEWFHVALEAGDLWYMAPGMFHATDC